MFFSARSLFTSFNVLTQSYNFYSVFFSQVIFQEDERIFACITKSTRQTMWKSHSPKKKTMFAAPLDVQVRYVTSNLFWLASYNKWICQNCANSNFIIPALHNQNHYAVDDKLYKLYLAHYVVSSNIHSVCELNE